MPQKKDWLAVGRINTIAKNKVTLRLIPNGFSAALALLCKMPCSYSKCFGVWRRYWIYPFILRLVYGGGN